MKLVEKFREFLKEIKRYCEEGRLESYTDWRVVSRHGEPLSAMGLVVLASEIDRKRNSCTKVGEVSVWVPRGSVGV